MIEPKGKKQLTKSRLSSASIDTIWSVLMDSTKLPHWAPPVKGLVRCDNGGEKVGSIRVCNASLAGRTGTIVERVVDMKEKSHITYVVGDDSFGMGKMFAHYGFRLSLSSHGPKTRITIESFYTPRNPIYALMNQLMMKRQFSGVLNGLINGLSDYATGQENYSVTADLDASATN